MNNIKAVFSTIGASNHTSSEREINDYYATDPIATELLLGLETFSHDIWEPACGEGHISKVLTDNGYNVLSTDLIDRGFGIGGVDFLETSDIFDGDIITNPPYKYAEEFVRHAIESISDGHKVAMFLKLTFLEGKKRRALFDKYPPQKFMFRPAEFNVAKMAILAQSKEKIIPQLPTAGTYGISRVLAKRRSNGLIEVKYG